MLSKPYIYQQLKSLFQQACLADVTALKPGNVGMHGDGHGMQYQAFIRSAELSAESICKPDTSLGEKILQTVKAVRTEIPYNTNLGIVLLCAPLIQAVYCRGQAESLRGALSSVLAATTVDDAAKAYQAIRLAQAGGLGSVEKQDVATEPTVTLYQAMHLAREHDLIAQQYVNDYQQVFGQALPTYFEFQSKWGYNDYSATGVFLMLLAEYPDSLVARKFSLATAKQLQNDAKPLYYEFSKSRNPDDLRGELMAMDRCLKNKGINPGTTADLVVAVVLAANLGLFFVNKN